MSRYHNFTVINLPPFHRRKFTVPPHRLSIITVDLSQHYAQLCEILCVHLKDYTTRYILHFPELRCIYISILRYLSLLYSPFPSPYYSWRRYKGLHLNIKRLSKCKYFFSLSLALCCDQTFRLGNRDASPDANNAIAISLSWLWVCLNSPLHELVFAELTQKRRVASRYSYRYSIFTIYSRAVNACMRAGVCGAREIEKKISPASRSDL